MSLIDLKAKIVSPEEPKWSEVVSKHVESKMSQVATDMSIVLTALLEEQKNKESSICNFYNIYNIAESTVVDKKDWMAQEREIRLKLFNEALNINATNEDIKWLLTLGKLVEGKNRPVLIEYC